MDPGRTLVPAAPPASPAPLPVDVVQALDRPNSAVFAGIDADTAAAHICSR